MSSPGSSQALRSIRVRELQAWVRLGWPAHERRRAQEVRLDVELRFGRALDAEGTDDLAGTVDYGGLCAELVALCESREFRLIESLGAECLRLARARVARSTSPDARVAVRVRKVVPPVQGLLGGVEFSCGDFEIP